MLDWKFSSKTNTLTYFSRPCIKIFFYNLSPSPRGLSWNPWTAKLCPTTTNTSSTPWISGPWRSGWSHATTVTSGSSSPISSESSPTAARTTPPTPSTSTAPEWWKSTSWRSSGITASSTASTVHFQVARQFVPNVQGILKGEVSLYCWPPVWLVWNQLYDNWQFLFLFAKQTNPNQSTRRSTVQWYFPL